MKYNHNQPLTIKSSSKEIVLSAGTKFDLSQTKDTFVVEAGGQQIAVSKDVVKRLRTLASGVSSVDIDAIKNFGGGTDTLASAFRVALKKNMEFLTKEATNVRVFEDEDGDVLRVSLDPTWNRGNLDVNEVTGLAKLMADITAIKQDGAEMFKCTFIIKGGARLEVLAP